MILITLPFESPFPIAVLVKDRDFDRLTVFHGKLDLNLKFIPGNHSKFLFSVPLCGINSVSAVAMCRSSLIKTEKSHFKIY